jgi:hypothetical protein
MGSKQGPPMKKMQPQNASGSKQRLPLKKEETPKIGNSQLTEASFTKLTLESEGDAFRFHRKMQNANNKSHEGDFTKRKIRNRQFTEASFAKLTLEGEGDAFRFHHKYKMLTANLTKASSQNQKSGTISSLKLASLNQLLKARLMLFGSNCKVTRRRPIKAKN